MTHYKWQRIARSHAPRTLIECRASKMRLHIRKFCYRCTSEVIELSTRLVGDEWSANPLCGLCSSVAARTRRISAGFLAWVLIPASKVSTNSVHYFFDRSQGLLRPLFWILNILLVVFPEWWLSRIFSDDLLLMGANFDVLQKLSFLKCNHLKLTSD